MRPDEIGPDHQKKAVLRYTQREGTTCLRGQLLGQHKKEWTSARRIDNRKESAEDKQEHFDRIGHFVPRFLKDFDFGGYQ